MGNTYGQFCPMARGSEVLAERWTPIILRNVLSGCHTFNEIAAGAPGLSRALLTRRLRELEHAGVLTIRPKPGGRGSFYEPTQAGRGLWPVLRALGDWAEQWLDVRPEHADPGVVLWSWSEGFLCRELLPDRRVVVRFEYPRLRRKEIAWLLVERHEAEICRFDPGFGDDVVVVVEDQLVFARWHLGQVEWAAALRSGAVRVSGDPDLRRALPTWNRGPQIHAHLRTETLRVPGSPPVPPPGLGGTPPPPGAVDGKPPHIARCRSASEAAAALRFGRDRGLEIAVGGPGQGVGCDGGVVVDLGPMQQVSIDPAARTVTAQAGVRWGELDATSQAFGLATTGAAVSHAAVAGHTLGGGVGWLMRCHGLTADNLLAAEVLTADGEHRVADDQENPDLFWGLRGGGAGLGIVTSLTYRLHPIGPEVLAGPVVWAMEDAPDVLRAYREFAAAAPREVASCVRLRRAAPAAFLPVELHHRPVCEVWLLALAEPEAAQRLLAPLRACGRPLLDMVKYRPYTNLQSATDGTGWHHHRESIGLDGLDDAVIDAMVEHTARARSPWSQVQLFQLGGAVADVHRDATAYCGRDLAFELLVTAAGPPMGPAETASARTCAAELASHRAGESSGVPERLVELRRRYDPDRVLQPRHQTAPLAGA